MSEHYGLEINKWFDVSLPKETIYSRFITGSLYILKKLFGFQKYLDLNQGAVLNENVLVTWAFHLDKRYIPKYNWLRFKIDNVRLSEENKKIIARIETENSVFVHIRRGDYLSPTFKHIFEGTCSKEYYKCALELIKTKIDKPSFFVFSDDIEWVKSNLQIENPTYIDWNVGADSPLDMYLMSKCKAAIIANSTFSYWGAILGTEKTIVCCPKQWYSESFEDPDIYLDNWIKI